MDHANQVTRRRESPAALDLWDAFDDLRRDFERSFGGLELPSVSGLLDWPTGPAIDRRRARCRASAASFSQICRSMPRSASTTSTLSISPKIMCEAFR